MTRQDWPAAQLTVQRFLLSDAPRRRGGSVPAAHRTPAIKQRDGSPDAQHVARGACVLGLLCASACVDLSVPALVGSGDAALTASAAFDAGGDPESAASGPDTRPDTPALADSVEGPGDRAAIDVAMLDGPGGTDRPGATDVAGDSERVDSGCAWPGPSELLAEWHADGKLDNQVACSPWAAKMVGTVPYGPGRKGMAWQFRSRQTSAQSDPNYLAVPASTGRALATLTIDAWVNQTHHNDYGESNRFIATSVWPTFTVAAAGDWALYVHESHEIHFYVRTGAGNVSGTDWVTCHFQAADTPLNTWVRYTATYDGVTARCYRNGQPLSNAPLRAGKATPHGQVFVGRNYPGDVDSLRVFARALTASEIAQSWP